MYIVIVKWNGKKFDVEMDTKEKGLVFKAQLYALTGVEPSRQKIMIKGGLIKAGILNGKCGFVCY